MPGTISAVGPSVLTTMEERFRPGSDKSRRDAGKEARGGAGRHAVKRTETPLAGSAGRRDSRWALDREKAYAQSGRAAAESSSADDGMRRHKALFLVFFFSILSILFVIGGCGGRKAYPPVSGEKRPAVRKARPAVVRKALPRMGYTIQAGAFSQAENAARLTELLKDQGLDATYFAARTGLFKVRIGNFPTRESARNQAEALQLLGLIEEYYLVAPEEYAVARVGELGEDYLRRELVKAARSFIGVPYLWGGTSAETGFDCSGLTMTVYQLNGIDLPRTSGDQFGAGEKRDDDDLLPGDLVFFATGKGGKVSHVGVYIGADRFVHAPGRGKKIRTDTLSSSYYKRRYLGARTYI